jgi:predicted glutamine amidotransferase
MRLSFFPATSTNYLSNTQADSKRGPQFGCRMEGAVTSDSAQGDRFIPRMLEALPKTAKGGNDFLEGVNPTARLLGNDQSDGWGFGGFRLKRLMHVARAQNIATDSKFSFFRDILRRSPFSSAIVHARRASDNEGLKTENTHPFRFSLPDATWTFAHNGRWPQAHSDNVKKALDKSPFQPQGDTDSEKAFLYLLQSVQQKLGTLNARKAGRNTTIRAFADAIRTLNQETAPSEFQDIPASNLGIRGKIRVGPASNFIANDGNLMIAYKNGQSLFLGVQLGKDGKPVAHTVATTPREAPGLRWFDVPENTMVVISRNPKNGQSEAEMLPLG